MIRSIQSNSQFGQDLWVIRVLQGKRNGYFLEIGAGDGLWISNTLVLERELGWTGLLVEPSGAFHRLVGNRPGAICVDCCIAAEEREVTLFEIFDRGQAGISELAAGNTLLSQVRNDIGSSEGEQKTSSQWGEFRRAVRKQAYPLATVLERHHAPRVIDYFSLDVEGFEFEILRNFPFDRYRFRCLGVERPTKLLHALLCGNGYVARQRLGEDILYTNSPES
jgi:hypothetical protein